MESISNKSEKNFSIKNKNCVSYKSVSEISEFEEYVEEEPSDFVIRTKKNEKSTQSNKLNESVHSAVSNFSKDIFEEKDEEENNNNNNINNNNIENPDKKNNSK
jgi:hypothetical protein